MDLKALLIEAKQKVPPVLQVLQTGDETMLDIGGKSKFFWGGKLHQDIYSICYIFGLFVLVVWDSESPKQLMIYSCQNSPGPLAPRGFVSKCVKVSMFLFCLYFPFKSTTQRTRSESQALKGPLCRVFRPLRVLLLVWRRAVEWT